MSYETATMVAATVHLSIPYACAALGGVLCERSGVVNIALEGTLLSSALASIAVAHGSGSSVAGVLAGVACGALVGLVHAAFTLRARIDAIVSGLAINVIAAGGTRFVLRALYGTSTNSPRIHGFRLGGENLVTRTLFDPFVLLTIVAVAATAWTLRATRFGLHVRACGEDPSAAHAVGIDVTMTRFIAVTLGGAAAGLGGSALAFELHQFQAGMSGGRGFIALAAVIVSGWRPWVALVACLAFAALDAMQVVVQGQTAVPPQLLAILPFVATLGALVLVGRRAGWTSRPPAGIGKHATP